VVVTVTVEAADIRIPVAISARHVHLCQRTINVLFGCGYVLRPLKPLSQPGQFASEETVALVGPTGRIPHVRVLGPPRSEDQIEISRTDELALGLNAPLRLSGDLGGTPGILVEGRAGRARLDAGLVRALRHIHMSPADAVRLGAKDRDIVRVAVSGGGRDLIFDDVAVRVAEQFRLELHLDSDEGNAAGIGPESVCRLIRADAREV
jgi:acetate kinase